MKYLIGLFVLLIGCTDTDQVNKQAALLCGIQKRLEKLESKTKVTVDEQYKFICNGFDTPVKTEGH